MNKQKEKPRDFEKAMERLDEIVREMESGDLCLEKMMSHFEEGTEMLALCSRKLNEVERKIEQLVAKNGKIETAPFETEETEPPAAGTDDRGDEP